MSYLALILPGGQNITAPKGLPSGGLTTVTKVIGNAVTLLLIITAVLSLIFLVLGGVQWAYSGGDKQKVASARARITYAIIGLIVAMAAFFIISVIGFVFNVKLIGV